MTMKLEQVRDWLRRYAKNADNYFDRKRKALELTIADKMADAIDAHLAQPAQSVDVAKVREVIAALRSIKQDHHDAWADKLEAAIRGEPS